VRSVDLDGEGHDLASGVGNNVVLVVFELVALAKVDVATLGVEVALSVGNLEFTLDVAVVIRGLVVIHLLPAGSLHGIAGHTRTHGLGDIAMSGNGGDEAGNGNDSRGEGQHLD